jgi:hypothetical protein
MLYQLSYPRARRILDDHPESIVPRKIAQRTASLFAPTDTDGDGAVSARSGDCDATRCFRFLGQE